VLGAAGYRVEIAKPKANGNARPLCCGRTFLAVGKVGEARHEAERAVDALTPNLHVRRISGRRSGSKPAFVAASSVGKALGGGVLPVSAFVARREVMEVFTPGSHGSTFGGNPLAAAIGLESLRVIHDEGLVERSRVLGQHMLARLAVIKSPVVKAVRGRGLWAAAEINPDLATAREVCERLLAKGVLSKETHKTVVRLAPPLVISSSDLDWAVDQLIDVIHELERTRVQHLAA
jgi:adenosylmethionine-8-amino-7-oxononanoate aminotransferase